MAGESEFIKDHGHVYADTSGKNGWRFAMKVATGISIPLTVAAIINLFYIGQWTGSVDEKLSSMSRDLDSFVLDQRSVMERIRILELENAARRGLYRQEEE